MIDCIFDGYNCNDKWHWVFHGHIEQFSSRFCCNRGIFQWWDFYYRQLLHIKTVLSRYIKLRWWWRWSMQYTWWYCLPKMISSTNYTTRASCCLDWLVLCAWFYLRFPYCIFYWCNNFDNFTGFEQIKYLFLEKKKTICK